MPYIPSEGLRWSGVLKSIAKAVNLLQPLFEAFTNSLEAIDMRKKSGEEFAPYIRLDFYFYSRKYNYIGQCVTLKKNYLFQYSFTIA